MKKDVKKTRPQLHRQWQVKNDKCKVCVNNIDCKIVQNGVQQCRDFIERNEQEDLPPGA